MRFLRQNGALIVSLVLLALVPLEAHSPYILHLCIMSMIFAMLSASWNLINGYAGIFTFGHQAFFGLGAYFSALLAMRLGMSPWVTLWIGGIAAAMAGLLIGLPILRIRSVAHVAIVTLAFAEIVETVVSNMTDLTRGALGLAGIPAFPTLHLPGVGAVAFGAGDPASYYYVALALLILAMALLAWLTASPTGLALKAIRDSPKAAESLGVDLTRYKLLAFVVSSFIAGVAGAFYAHYLHILTPDSALGVSLMITILVITLIGGIGTTIGPLGGAFLVTFGLELLRAVGDWRMMVYGVLLVLFVLFLPQGLARLGIRIGARRRPFGPR